ncbi:putative zinc-binding oxidoreductase [Cladobotryum mycophilum]|uniref:Zinc-binding oxidoreductase n=1 Tax=Cladobotryum mycophilum TaxID=491253 RepID=A0ABR0SRQ4_9HYPO
MLQIPHIFFRNDTMKAIEVIGPKTSPEVTLNPSAPKPIPKSAEILIKVHAAGITADELAWPELWEEVPVRIPGHDISGVVAALGPDYKGSLSVGDDVYSMLHAVRGLGQAEFSIAEDEEVAKKPKSITHAQAAALPIPVLTAWEGVFEHAKLEKGTKVLITGASGAVGHVTVQIASKIAGAEVIALASSRHHDTLKELGASRVVDYNTPNWEDSIKDVDVVFDTVGDPILAKTWKTVKSDGLIITVGNTPPAWDFGNGEPEELKDHPDVKWFFFIVSSKNETLARVAGLIDDGTIKTLPVKGFSIDQGVEAWKVATQRGRTGKVVIEFVTKDSQQNGASKK